MLQTCTCTSCKRAQYRFHLNCLRKLLKITWRDKVPDTEVLSRSGLSSIYTLFKRAQVRWAGHLVRMSDTRLPKRVFCGELAGGKRSQGGQKKRYKDCLKASLKGFDIDTETWETEVQDRPGWQGQISKGAVFFEQNRVAEAQRKLELRKSKAASLSPAHGDHLCAVCDKTFRTRIGLISHMNRKHNT